MVDRNDARNVGLHDALNVRVVPPHPPARPVRLALLQPVRHLPVLVLSVLAHVLVGSEVRVRAASAAQGRLARESAVFLPHSCVAVEARGQSFLSMSLSGSMTGFGYQKCGLFWRTTTATRRTSVSCQRIRHDV